MKTNQDKIAAVSTYLNTVVVERNDEVRNILVCIFSGQNAFFLGLPGVAKSLLITELVNCFEKDINYFNILMGATTVPEEIFGATDITKLLKDKIMKRDITGFLPEANIAFIDEVFKGNSAILNTLLRVINEKKYKDGKDDIDVPLISVFSASNEIPTDSTLRAFFDRFICRMVVNPIKQKSNFIKMLEGVDVDPPKVLSLDFIQEVREEVQMVNVSEDFYDKYFDLRCELAAKMPKLHVSDRKFKKMIDFLKASCYIMGGSTVTQDYLIYLKDCLWEEPEQVKEIARILSNYVSPSVSRSNNLFAECMALFDRASQVKTRKEISDLYSEIKTRRSEIAVKIDNDPDNKPFYNEILNKLDPAIAELKKKVLSSV